MKKEMSVNVRLDQQQTNLLNLLLIHYKGQTKTLDLNTSDIIRMAINQMAERDLPFMFADKKSK